MEIEEAEVDYLKHRTQSIAGLLAQRLAEGPELVLLGVAAILEERVCYSSKRSGGGAAYLSCLG